MRRLTKLMGLLAGIAVIAVIGVMAGLWVAGNTQAGRQFLEQTTLRASGGSVRLTGLGGTLPFSLTLDRLQLLDAQGVWLDAEQVSLRWSPIELLWRWIHLTDLKVKRLHMERTPSGNGKSGGTVTIPHIVVAQIDIDVLELGAPLAGTPARLSLSGYVKLPSLASAKTDLVAHRLDGDGDYKLKLAFDGARMDLALKVHEPAGGPLENILQLPGLGALSGSVEMKGLKSAERIDLSIEASSLHATVTGTLNVLHPAGDLSYAIRSAAMSPRPGLSWQRLDLSGSWHGPLENALADGRLIVAGLVVPGPVKAADIDAVLKGRAGLASLTGRIRELQIPGSNPGVLSAEPIAVEASLNFKEAGRPLQVTATQRLFSLRAQAKTAGERRVAFDLRLPDLAPLAALAGEDVAGQAAIKGTVIPGPAQTAIRVDADLGLSGGSAPYVPILGPRSTLQFVGGVSPATIKFDKLRLAGNGVALSANGAVGLAQASTAGSIQARWDLTMSDVSVLASGLAGTLKGTGSVSGLTHALAVDADLSSNLSVHGSPPGTLRLSARARGLPSAPNGSVTVQGRLDNAPLQFDVALERRPGGTLRAFVRHGEWKSVRVTGDLTSSNGLARTQGRVQLQIQQLGDFDRLLGNSLAGQIDGSAEFQPAGGVSRITATLDAHGLAVGSLKSDVRLRADGPLDALNLDLDAQLPQVAGQPASVKASAVLAAHAKQLRIAHVVANAHGQAVQLTAPATLSFGNVLTVDRLKLAAKEAALEVRGQFSPNLDLRIGLAQLKPDLVDAFFPGLLAQGRIDGQARLQGSPTAPTGRLRIDASGLRFGGDSATGLPAVDAGLRADLNGSSAAVDLHVEAGAKRLISAAGTLPLMADGPLDLKLGGKLDMALIGPLLEARGMHATGELALDATVAGTRNAPQIGGAVTLSNGSLRDYVRGVNLSDINAEAQGSNGSLELKRLDAKAASGSVSMSGSVGVLLPDIPVDLKLTAKNAQPITSNILTANLDADLHVKGTARQRLDVAGRVRVNRATIGIPNSFPPDVAVLDVRRRGQGTSSDQNGKSTVIGVDVTIKAPQQILVQGRGLDAELGGEVHLTGTTDQLLASGGFDLQRGSFTLVGNRLNFTEGRVSFDGAGLRKKIDPTLDFKAETTLTDVTAVLRITGPADAPRFEFSSTPTSLPQDQIMARLLFGENAGQLTALQAAQIGAALATLSGVGGGGSNPLVKLQKSLGLDRLSVGSANSQTGARTRDSNGASIEAGRYVSKRVYIEGKQTTTGSSQVQVDVDLTKRLKLQTRLGTGNTAITQGTTPENDPGSSIGLSYTFEY